MVPTSDGGNGHPGNDRGPGDGVAAHPDQVFEPGHVVRRELGQSGQRASERVWTPNGGPEEGPDHHGIEVCSRTSGQFLFCRRRTHRSFVRPCRSHRLVTVRDGDDAAPERDLLACEPVGVPSSVELLVMLDDRVSPRTQPVGQRGRESGSLLRVSLHDGPLVRVELGRLVEDVFRDRHFSDVMQKSRPTQPISIMGGQLQLVGDEIGQNPHPFRVTSGQAIMTTEGSGECQDAFRRLRRFVVNPLGMGVFHLAFERLRASGPAGHSHAIWRLVREDERHLEQRRQRESARLARCPTNT